MVELTLLTQDVRELLLCPAATLLHACFAACLCLLIYVSAQHNRQQVLNRCSSTICNLAGAVSFCGGCCSAMGLQAAGFTLSGPCFTCKSCGGWP